VKKKAIKPKKKLIYRLKTGDILYTSCGDYPICYHLGIVVSDEKGKRVYHNSPENKNRFGGSIVCEKYEAFTKNRQVLKVIESNVSKEKIIEVSRECKKETWDTFFFNCEDYVLQIVDGHRRSDLRDTFKIAALGILIIILI
jgi:hypothetical protein